MIEQRFELFGRVPIGFRRQLAPGETGLGRSFNILPITCMVQALDSDRLMVSLLDRRDGKKQERELRREEINAAKIYYSVLLIGIRTRWLPDS